MKKVVSVLAGVAACHAMLVAAVTLLIDGITEIIFGLGM